MKILLRLCCATKRLVDLIKWTGVLLAAEKPSCRITTKVLKSEFQHCPRTDGCEE